MRHSTVDEFSVSDIRQTFSEVFHVISARRWFFLFPFCIVATLAFLGSLLVPREYTASTIIKREHDPVFANMMIKSWTQPYNDIRQRLAKDIKNRDFIEEILVTQNLPEGLDQYEDGTLTPASQATRKSLARSIAAGMKATPLETSKHRDIVRIDLTLNDPKTAEKYLPIVRDAYMTRAHDQTVDILKNVKGFLKTESNHTNAKLSNMRQKLSEYELKYPGIRPGSIDPGNAERAALVIERVKVEHRQEELAARREHLQKELAQWINPNDPSGASAAPAMIEEPNPRYAELVKEIQQLKQKIIEGKTTHSMTEEHPMIRRARTLLATRQAALAEMPRTLRVSAKVAGVQASQVKIDKLRSQLEDTETRLEGSQKRLKEIQIRFNVIQQRKEKTAEHKQDYLKLRSEVGHLESELNAWMQNIAPIQQVLYLDGKNRSIHFTTVRDVAAITKPSSPTSTLVNMVCLGMGLAAAIIMVLLVELLDRSYRTVKQLTTSLGIPVIESIDEILTQASFRRRKIRKFLVMPMLTMLMLCVMALAGSVAYWSLEHPFWLTSDDIVNALRS